MAITTSTASNPLITTISVDTDCDTTVEAAASGNKTLYAVEIINPNATEDVYVHIVNAASSDNPTTASQHNSQFYCPANTTIYYYAPAGYITDTGLSLYCTTSAGGGQSASAPTENVTVTLGYTAR